MPPDQILDNTLRLIGNSLMGYSYALETFATRIALAMTVLQIVLSFVHAGQGVLAHHTTTWYLGDLARRIVPAFGILWLLSNVAVWGPGFFDAYNAFAGSLAGGAPLTPSGIFDYGLKMVSTIAGKRSLGMWLIGVITLEDLFFGIFCLVVILTWASIAWLFLFVALEMIAYVVIGTMVVCWSPLDYARGCAMSWLRLVIGTGTKVVTLALILGGIIVMANWWQDILNTSPINLQRLYWESCTMVVAVVCFFIAHTIPNKVAATIIIEGGAGGAHDDRAYGAVSGWARQGVRMLGV